MEPAGPDPIVAFGPFRLDRARRKLLCGADEIRIGGRAMDILLALAASKGELVSKDELFHAAWPDTFVHNDNLKVTVAYLRRALRQHAPGDFINTVVGRGYWLGVDTVSDESERPAKPPAPQSKIPEIADIVGRDAEVAALQAMLASHRLVTIVGAGGIGKTTVAAALAHRAAAADRTVTFVDLSRVTSEEFVAAALAAALGISSNGNSLSAITSILARQDALLVLDTCEHVLNAVAHICDVLLARTRHIRILATSRELLRARSEQVLWLTPLAVPPADHPDEIDDLLRYSAARLLVNRAFENSGYVARSDEARPLSRICRRLDGSPLAIELVAPRLAARGAEAVLDELEDRLLVLRQERRQAPRRHQTLLVTLRWSYALLTGQEAAVLRAVSIFAGSFSPEAAVQIGSSVGLSPIEIVDALAGLRAKSMLAIDSAADELRYRLLDSTRVFAGELLDEQGDKARISQAHALHLLDMLGRAASDQPILAQGHWRRIYLQFVDDLRKAIDWTLNRSADPLLGIRLVAAGLPLWHELSAGEEIRANCVRALAELTRIGCADTLLKLQLVVGLTAVSTYLSADPDEASALFATAVELARGTGDPQAECRALGAFATYELLRGRGQAVAGALGAMREAAARSQLPAARWEECQLRAQYEIRIGAFDAALIRVNRLADEMRGEAKRAVPRFQVHQRMSVDIQMAALNWLTGRSREAVRVANLAAAHAREIEHGLTLIHCLSQGVVWTLVQCGEYDAVLPQIDVLRSAIYRHGMAAWIPVADTYTAAIAAFRGQKPDPARLRSAFYGVRAGVAQIRHDARYTMLAEAMLANGQAGDAAEVIEHVLDTSSNPWGHSELLRLRAATRLAEGKQEDAHALLVEAHGLAEGSGSLAWALRSANDLAAMLCDRGEAGAARAILAPIYHRFPTDFETRDLRKARELLATLDRHD